MPREFYVKRWICSNESAPHCGKSHRLCDMPRFSIDDEVARWHNVWGIAMADIVPKFKRPGGLDKGVTRSPGLRKLRPGYVQVFC
jgi:hypothetical protein